MTGGFPLFAEHVFSIPVSPFWLPLAALLLDFCIGDPLWLPHPVRWIGALISFLEKRLYPAAITGKGAAHKAAGDEARAPRTAEEKRRAGEQSLRGGILVALVLIITGGVTAGAIAAADRLHPAAGLVLRLVIATYTLAARSLADAANAVRKALRTGGLSEARAAVAMIVGRDTDRLEEAGIVKATVESVAESTSDGVVTPLFFLALAGPVGAMLFKAVNTMDSMIGYKSERYLYFGRAAAKLDDALNYLPARISGVLVMAAAALCGCDVRGAFRMYRRDRKKHASPNAAQTESAFAGALGLRLNGDAYYGGVLIHKPTVGDDSWPAVQEDIGRANRLMLCTSALAAGLFTAAVWFAERCFGI